MVLLTFNFGLSVNNPRQRLFSIVVSSNEFSTREMLLILICQVKIYIYAAKQLFYLEFDGIIGDQAYNVILSMVDVNR